MKKKTEQYCYHCGILCLSCGEKINLNNLEESLTIEFKAKWDKSGKNLILPIELKELIDSKYIKLEFFNK